MNDAQEKLITRIRRLLALAEGSSNPHEASNAAAEAQRLMVEHQTGAATLEESGGPAPVEKAYVQDTPGVKRATLWQASLAAVLGRHLHVAISYTPGTDRITAVGRGPDVAALALLYASLKLQLSRWCDAEWDGKPRAERRYLTNEQGGKPRFTDTFHRGARDEVDERMTKSREATLALAECGGATALVRVERYAEEAKAAIQRWQEDNGFKTRTSTRRVAQGSADAYSAGRAAGARASLTPSARLLGGR